MRLSWTPCCRLGASACRAIPFTITRFIRRAFGTGCVRKPGGVCYARAISAFRRRGGGWRSRSRFLPLSTRCWRCSSERFGGDGSRHRSSIHHRSLSSGIGGAARRYCTNCWCSMSGSAARRRFNASPPSISSSPSGSFDGFVDGCSRRSGRWTTCKRGGTGPKKTSSPCW